MTGCLGGFPVPERFQVVDHSPLVGLRRFGVLTGFITFLFGSASRWAPLAMFGGLALWLALGFILWQSCRAVCPDYGHDPMGGNVGWNRESLFLYVGGFACFLVGLWGAFHLALLLIWLFTWLMLG